VGKKLPEGVVEQVASQGVESRSSNKNYPGFLAAIKQHIYEARVQAYRTVNRGMIDLYWKIGREITERQIREGWGKSVVEKLSLDLRKEFPGASGFSSQNLWFMRQLYVEYKELSNLLQLVREIPWGQNIAIMTKVRKPEEREYYLGMTGEMGWSRSILLHQIKTDAYRRHRLAEKQHTFHRTLPAALAEQADETMKDVYVLDFLGITKPVVERELERRMISRIRDVLLEFGQGFAFLGNQYPIKLEGDEYFVDLLFFHRKLKCLVAIELKAGKFKAEHAGKMNFYLNLLNDFIREPHENPSIGIILCGDRNKLDVEYALMGIDKPMGMAEYTLTKELPAELSGKLPKPEDLEKEIMEDLGGGESDHA
jgi:predicted nuclease of restriction endonuclease-like (RecB) superfamily